MNKISSLQSSPASIISLGKDTKHNTFISQHSSNVFICSNIGYIEMLCADTLIFLISVLLMVPPKARSSLGVGGLGPNSASPFFFSSSTLAAAGPLAFISFLHTEK